MVQYITWNWTEGPESNQSLNIFSETLQYQQILSSKYIYIYSVLSGQTDDLLWHYFKFPVGLIGSRGCNIVTYKDNGAHCPEDIYTVTQRFSYGQHWKMKKELTLKPLSYVCTAGQSVYKAIRSPHTLLQWQSTRCRRHTVFQPHQQLLPLSSLKH